MREDHTPAAVSFELQFIESITKGEQLRREKKQRGRNSDGPFAHVFRKEIKVGVPFVTDDFPA